VNVANWVVAALAGLVPVALYVLTVFRSPYLRMHWLSFLGALATSAALVVPLTFVQRYLERWAEIDPVAGTGGHFMLLLYGFLVIAPLEMGLCTLAVMPFWRLRRIRMRAGLSRAIETREAVTFAVGAAIGCATLRGGIYLRAHAASWISVGRSALWLLTFILLCGLWGYVLGRYAARGMRSKRFSSAWVGSTVFAAVCDQMIFRRGPLALAAVTPLVLSMLVVAFVLWRDVQAAEGGSSGGRLSSIFSVAPTPSLAAIREAFRQQDRPLTLRWITFGALVTTGVITTGVVVAVLLGHRVGLDFSAVDREQAGGDALAPLALLGAGALTAFPTAGYLLARASGTRSVLEPAMATSLAMVLLMVFLGMLAPTAVVFAIAFAPIAFVLSCLGAWVGLAH
jgi:hypothetical protein